MAIRRGNGGGTCQKMTKWKMILSNIDIRGQMSGIGKVTDGWVRRRIFSLSLDTCLLSTVARRAATRRFSVPER
jgi:hypothetical protein